MNLAELQRKLIAAARRQPPADRVPYAFEKRITALLQAKPAPDRLAFWARGLWRSAVACLAIVLLMGAVSFLTPNPSESSGEMSEDFENTLLAAVDQESDWSQ